MEAVHLAMGFDFFLGEIRLTSQERKVGGGVDDEWRTATKGIGTITDISDRAQP